jgi:hypothetical protein
VMAFHYLMQTIVQPRVQISHIGNHRETDPYPWKTKCDSQAMVVLPAICDILRGWYELLVKVVTLFGCGRSKDHHCTRFSISVITEYQSHQKFCVHLRGGFTKQHRVHSLPCHTAAAHVLQFLIVRNHSLSHFYVKLCDLESYAGIFLQWLYHFHYKICT